MESRLISHINDYTKYSIYQYLEITQAEKNKYETTLSSYLKYIASWNDLNAICDMKENIDNTYSIIETKLSELTKENMKTLITISTLLHDNYIEQFSVNKIFIQLINFFSTSELLNSYLEEEKSSSIYRIITNFFDAILKSKDIEMIRLLEKNNLEKLLRILEVMVLRGKETDLKSLKSSLFLYIISHKTVNSLIELNLKELNDYIFNLDYENFIIQDKIEDEIKEKKIKNENILTKIVNYKFF